MGEPLWKRPSFFKVMLGKFETTLRIPPLFERQLSPKLSGNECTLRIPGVDGQWHARIGKGKRGEWFFKNGWEAFVADHSISLGDFLVFIYNGDLGFDVKIYGSSGCEKENVASKRGTNGPMDEDDDDDELSIMSERRPYVVLDTSSESIQSGKRALTKKDGKWFFKAASSFKSSHPTFVALYKKNCLYRMRLSTSIVRELNLRSNQNTILYDSCGRQWPVKIRRRTDGSMDLGIGWSNFSRGNHLHVGDACVFEFIRGADAIKVHIYREGETS